MLSSILGFIGSILLFCFGLPPRVSEGGVGYLILEQQDEKEAKKYKIYKKIGYIGIIFISLSFLVEIFNNIFN